jgi:hypothetical protein
MFWQNPLPKSSENVSHGKNLVRYTNRRKEYSSASEPLIGTVGLRGDRATEIRQAKRHKKYLR